MAGSEAAWQAANAGVQVVIHEMRPKVETFAHRTGNLGEMVCSNSFRSDDHEHNAVELLHEEMRRLNSLIMQEGAKAAVPAGGALAVDRDIFSDGVTKALNDHPLITIQRGEVAAIPPEEWDSVIIATGPLTSPDLAKAIQERGANELAKRVIQMSRHIFQYAIITGRAERNIANDLKGLIKPKPKTHFAAIDHRDLPEFLGALYSNKARLMPLTHLAVQFMMLTFVRTSEMIKAEWREFDFKEKVWLIPAKRMKMGKEHLVPLSDQAIRVLRETRQLHNNKTFVFPSRENSQNHMSNNTILMALCR